LKPYSHLLANLNEEDISKMLKALGAESIEDLYSDVPQDAMAKVPVSIPGPYTQMEIERAMDEKLAGDKVQPSFPCFLGGGVWPHYVPPAVQFIISRSEFYTSYTPYQAETSQGMLQALFEYQNLICDLTKMDAANASMYDWPTAAAEAALMAMRATGRKKVLVSRAAGYDRRRAIKTYVEAAGGRLVELGYDPRTGLTLMDRAKPELEDAAAVYVEQPNFFGAIEDCALELGEEAHRKNSLFIVGVEPISLGLLKPPGEYGADIVVGEGQPLGMPMNYGGPLLGIFAARGDLAFIRQMPGRMVGRTTEKGGEVRGYVLVLQSREQHIRREKATSNICTNQALMALAASAYLSLLGGDGLRELSRTIHLNAHHVARRISGLSKYAVPYFESKFFGEFAIAHDSPSVSGEDIYRRLYAQGVLGGLPLKWFYGELPKAALISVTEVHMRKDVDRLVDALSKVG